MEKISKTTFQHIFDVILVFILGSPLHPTWPPCSNKAFPVFLSSDSVDKWIWIYHDISIERHPSPILKPELAFLIVIYMLHAYHIPTIQLFQQKKIISYLES